MHGQSSPPNEKMSALETIEEEEEVEEDVALDGCNLTCISDSRN
jgi:hypothetical protein